MSEHHVRGGRARAERLSPERRAEISRAAAEARWYGTTGKGRPKRKAPPLAVQLDAVCLQFLGVPRGECELDHEPPLGLRSVNDAGTDYDPPQHDPAHLTMRVKAPHRAKTHGVKRGESKFATREGGDQTAIAKAKRIEARRLTDAALRQIAKLPKIREIAEAALRGDPPPAEPATFRDRILAPTPREERAPRPAPKRSIRSRGFAKKEKRR